MKIKFIFLIVTIMFYGFTLTNCNKNTTDSLKLQKEKEYVKEMIGEEVYIQEENEYVPYIPLTNDYNGNTLLLRKNILNEDMRMNDYYAVYENCEVDKYLNKNFIEKMSNKVQQLICDTDIEIVDDNYFNFGASIKIINRKIFLLSYREIGLKNNYHVGIEGKALDYFTNSDSRISSKYLSNPSSWWLRSVDTIYDNCFYAVGPKGEVGSTDASGINGIRPAFCVPNNTPVIKNTELYEGKIVYAIQLE